MIYYNQFKEIVGLRQAVKATVFDTVIGGSNPPVPIALELNQDATYRKEV